jgi:uncharacterized protein (TIGR02145 family)
MKRNASFNLDEIKVRWKKAALENCTGVPCVVAPSFTCGTSTVSDYDGNVYETVSIVGTGVTQCWTKSNLKVTRYNDGSLIGDSTNSTWGTAMIGARTENKANGAVPSSPSVSGYVGTLGYLYNWYAVTDSRKLCPAGWHVPTDAEWTIMIQTLDPTQAVTSVNVLTFTGTQSGTAGTALKSGGTNPSTGSGLGWNPVSPPSPTSPGTNTSGFSGLPGGSRTSGGNFLNLRNLAFFWSATEYVPDYAWTRFLSYDNGRVSREYTFNTIGASVRCLRD